MTIYDEPRDWDAPKVDPIQWAYAMGRDCALNGPNQTNCHFSLFATPEQTRAWEKGKAEAETK
jgi:hypothetical protein